MLTTTSIPVIVPTDAPGIDAMDEPRSRVHAEPRSASTHVSAVTFDRLVSGEGFPPLTTTRRPLASHAQRKPSLLARIGDFLGALVEEVFA